MDEVWDNFRDPDVVLGWKVSSGFLIVVAIATILVFFIGMSIAINNVQNDKNWWSVGGEMMIYGGFGGGVLMGIFWGINNQYLDDENYPKKKTD